MPRMAMAMQSQLKKLKKLMTEKMSLEKAYSSVIRHCGRNGRMSGESFDRSKVRIDRLILLCQIYFSICIAVIATQFRY